MSEVSPNDQGLPAPDSDAVPSVTSRVHGIAPAWEPAEYISSLERSVFEDARRLSLEHADRSGMAGTAERVGTAVGSAQRQVRRGLELVRRLPASGAAHATQMEQEFLDRAASTIQDIGEGVADLRENAARHLDEWSEQADERMQKIRQEMNRALSRGRANAQRLADQYPLQTIAAIAGAGFALGVALRLGRRSRRG